MYRLSSDVVMRAEEKGVLFFQPRTQTAILLGLLGAEKLHQALNNGRKATNWPDTLKETLLDGEFICQGKDKESVLTLEHCIAQAKERQSPPRSLFAPEALHLAITSRCDQSCPGCYFGKNLNSQGKDMPFTLFTNIIKSAAKSEVLQVAIGGGEPLLVEYLSDAIRVVKDHKILPSLTTNGNLLSFDLAGKLKKAGLAHLQVSLNGATEEVNSLSRPNYFNAIKTLKVAKEAGISFGINFVVTKANLDQIEDAIQLAEEIGCKIFNILRPKPAAGNPRWLEENSPSPSEYLKLRKILRSSQYKVEIRIDSSLTFLMSDYSPEFLFREGIWGCTAARRFLSIIPDGRVAPCSHIPQYEPFNGDLLSLWHHSKIFASFRSVDDKIGNPCHECEHVTVCRGCRTVVSRTKDSFFDSDSHCIKYALDRDRSEFGTKFWELDKKLV
ncbi:MAG: radical SAM protein, partial [bacterium]|nr:radical SAM protein [bacterium]